MIRRVVEEKVVTTVTLLVFFQQVIRITPVFACVNIGVDVVDQCGGIGCLCFNAELVLGVVNDIAEAQNRDNTDGDEGNENLILNRKAGPSHHTPPPLLLRSSAETRNTANELRSTPGTAGCTASTP